MKQSQYCGGHFSRSAVRSKRTRPHLERSDFIVAQFERLEFRQTLQSAVEARDAIVRKVQHHQLTATAEVFDVRNAVLFQVTENPAE